MVVEQLGCGGVGQRLGVHGVEGLEPNVAAFEGDRFQPGGLAHVAGSGLFAGGG